MLSGGVTFFGVVAAGTVAVTQGASLVVIAHVPGRCVVGLRPRASSTLPQGPTGLPGVGNVALTIAFSRGAEAVRCPDDRDQGEVSAREISTTLTLNAASNCNPVVV